MLHQLRNVNHSKHKCTDTAVQVWERYHQHQHDITIRTFCSKSQLYLYYYIYSTVRLALPLRYELYIAGIQYTVHI